MSHPGLGHVDLDRHRLSQAEAERRFRERIVPQLLAPLRLKPQAQPTVVMLGGPPGVGKTSLAEVIARRLGNAGTLDVDSMRDFHPQYRELLQADELTAARYTNRDASRWLQMALAYAGERRWNLVKEGTLRVPERVEAGAQLLRDRGWHRVEAAYVAAPPACSQLSMVLRYLRQHDTLGAGRFVNVESHDLVAAGNLATAPHIDQGRYVDAVHVYRRDGQLVHTNQLDSAGQWTRPAGTRHAIETERGRALTAQEAQQFLDDLAEAAERAAPQWYADLTAIGQRARPLITEPEQLRTLDELTGQLSSAAQPAETTGRTDVRAARQAALGFPQPTRHALDSTQSDSPTAPGRPPHHSKQEDRGYDR